MSVSLFICDPWESYIRQLQDDSDREQLEMEREEDLDIEIARGVEAMRAAERDGCDPDDYLPEYAPRPYEICYPEVFRT